MIDATKSKVYGFKAIPKDLTSIAQKLIQKDDLCKLLFYTTKDAYNKDVLTSDQKEKLLEEEYIQIIPRVQLNEENKIQNYIVLNFDSFNANATNDMYFDGLFMVDILCHIDNWKINNKFGDLELRPYSIAQIILEICDTQKFSGIGKMQFYTAKQTILASDTDYCGLSLTFGFINSRYSSDKIPNGRSDIN
jgi:hypothetical protein